MKSRINGVERTADYWRRYFLNKKLRALGKPTIPLEPTPQATTKNNNEPDTPELPPISYRDDMETTYELKYARTNLMADRIMHNLSGNVFGFDAEWRISWGKGKPQRPTALVQICDGKIIALLHLIHMESFPNSLRSFLEDSTMLKTGVNVTGDATRLNKDFSLNTVGLVELSSNAHYVIPELAGTTRPTLAKLTSHLLKKSLNKGPVRVSNWERVQLSPEQKEYAATDAYVSYKLYRMLEARGAPMYTIEQEKIAKEAASGKNTKKQTDSKSTAIATATVSVNNTDIQNTQDTQAVITEDIAMPITKDIREASSHNNTIEITTSDNSNSLTSTIESRSDEMENVTITTTTNQELTSNANTELQSIAKRRQPRKSTSTDTVSACHTTNNHNRNNSDTCIEANSITFDETIVEVTETTTATEATETTTTIKRSRGRPKKNVTTSIASSMAAPTC